MYHAGEKLNLFLSRSLNNEATTQTFNKILALEILNFHEHVYGGVSSLTMLTLVPVVLNFYQLMFPSYRNQSVDLRLLHTYKAWHTYKCFVTRIFSWLDTVSF